MQQITTNITSSIDSKRQKNPTATQKSTPPTNTSTTIIKEEHILNNIQIQRVKKENLQQQKDAHTILRVIIIQQTTPNTTDQQEVNYYSTVNYLYNKTTDKKEKIDSLLSGPDKNIWTQAVSN